MLGTILFILNGTLPQGKGLSLMFAMFQNTNTVLI